VRHSAFPGCLHHSRSGFPSESHLTRLFACSVGTGSGGLPIRFNPLPGVRELRSPLVSADLDNCIALDVEHSAESPVADTFLFVKVSDPLDDFLWDRGIVVGRTNSEASLIESDHFRLLASITSILFGVVHRLPCSRLTWTLVGSCQPFACG